MKIPVLSPDLEKLSPQKLRELADQMREDYEEWKSEHPDSQQEDVINTFILIKRELKKRGTLLQAKNTTLDAEARSFEEITKIKPIPLFPEEHVFKEKCDFCDKSPEFLIITSYEQNSELGSFACAEHFDKAIDSLTVPVLRIEKLTELAPVLPSGEKEGERIFLTQIVEEIKDFLISEPISWMVGGVCEFEKEGTEGDADILFRFPSWERLKEIIEFRITRMFEPKIRKRIHILWEDNTPGPFTDNLPLFRLRMERIPDAEIQRMSEGEWAEVRLRTKRSEKQKITAEKAIKNDAITPGEFYLPCKPVKGYYSGKRQSVDLFLDIYDKFYEYPALSSKKFDGENCETHKIGNEVTIFSEDGSKINRLLNMKNEVKKLNPDMCVLQAEIEKWDYSGGGESKHYPRETVNTNELDDYFTANVYDILYFKGEVPDELFEEIEFFDQEGKEKWIVKYL